eukprot:14365027-Alexandrium_andersonii.AAC.1
MGAASTRVAKREHTRCMHAGTAYEEVIKLDMKRGQRTRAEALNARREMQVKNTMPRLVRRAIRLLLLPLPPPERGAKGPKAPLQTT